MKLGPRTSPNRFVALLAITFMIGLGALNHAAPPRSARVSSDTSDSSATNELTSSKAVVLGLVEGVTEFFYR